MLFMKYLGKITDVKDLVTKEYVDNHNWDAGDITSGTLALARGGTGQSVSSIADLKAGKDANGNTITTTYALKSTAVQVYNRTDIGTSPNFDNPGVNGLFEVRSTSEQSGGTGTRPYSSYGPMLTLKTPDNITMMQIAGAGDNWYIRGKQGANVTLSGVVWNRMAFVAAEDTTTKKVRVLAQSAYDAITTKSNDTIYFTYNG